MAPRGGRAPPCPPRMCQWRGHKRDSERTACVICPKHKNMSGEDSRKGWKRARVGVSYVEGRRNIGPHTLVKQKLWIHNQWKEKGSGLVELVW